MMQNTLYEYSPLQLSTLATPLHAALILRQVKRWQFPVFHSASRPIREIALVALDGYRNSEKYIHQTKKFLDLFAYLLERLYACMTVLVIAIACKPALEKHRKKALNFSYNTP